MKYLSKMTNTSLILWDLQKDAYNARDNFSDIQINSVGVVARVIFITITTTKLPTVKKEYH